MYSQLSVLCIVWNKIFKRSSSMELTHVETSILYEVGTDESDTKICESRCKPETSTILYYSSWANDVNFMEIKLKQINGLKNWRRIVWKDKDQLKQSRSSDKCWFSLLFISLHSKFPYFASCYRCKQTD